MPKTPNGTVIASDGYMDVRCGELQLCATYFMQTNSAYTKLTGTIKRGPAALVGRTIIVTTENNERGIIAIAKR